MKITVTPLTTDRITTIPETLDVDVEPCPRCGDHHDLLTLQRFQRPPSGTLGLARSAVLYWTTCPATGEPILAKLT